MNFKFCFLLVAATVVASVPVVEENQVVPKGRNLIIVEPFYDQYEYMNDDPEVMDEEMYPAGGSYGDLQLAESNIVFRPLFAYRKQMAKRRRIYTEPSVAPVPTPGVVGHIPSRRRYVVRYPVFRKNPNYPNAQYDYVP